MCPAYRLQLHRVHPAVHVGYRTVTFAIFISIDLKAKVPRSPSRDDFKTKKNISHLNNINKTSYLRVATK